MNSSARVIAMMLVGCAPPGCAADEQGGSGRSTHAPAEGGGGSHETALVEAAPGMCTIEPPVRRISLELAAADELGALDVDVSAHGTLRVVVGNSGSTDATVAVQARSRSEGGEANVAAGVADVSAGATANLDVEARSLGLSVGAFENSGTLILRAEGLFTDGSRSESEPMRIAFHPSPEGWVLYDLATRDSVYDGGALTVAARSARDRTLARLPEGVRLASTFAGSLEGHAAGWRPPVDGPPDTDAGGER